MKQMKDKIFVDTNVLLYLLSNDLEKKSIAKDILKSNNHISIQVLNEFSNVSLRKFQLSIDDTRELIQKISEKTIVFDFNENTILYALDLKNIYQYQFYDCLIIATALENNCNILYSEDMQHNQVIEDKLKIINPFEKLKKT
jgi:predicted nucleic acid-binding protein